MNSRLYSYEYARTTLQEVGRAAAAYRVRESLARGWEQMMDGNSFIFSIARIRRALRREFEDRAAALDITVAQFQVLRRLWQGDGILISVLGKDACSDGGTITGVLDRLEAKALIRRERSAEDRRAVHVFLTPGGMELETPLMQILAGIESLALEGFDSQERARILQDLNRIGETIGAD